MNVHPHIHTHPKYLLLRKRVGPGAMHYLTKLWGFCQLDHRGENLGKVTADYVETICDWDGEPGKLWSALCEAVCEGKAGWVKTDDSGNVIVHDWNKENHQLVTNWKNGERKRRESQRRKRDEEREARLMHSRSTAPTPPKQLPESGGTSAKPLDGTGCDVMGRDLTGCDGSTEGSPRAQSGSAGAEPKTGPPRPTPTLEQAIAYAQAHLPFSPPPTPEQIEAAWKSLEMTKSAKTGRWLDWRLREITDWRLGLEDRLAEVCKKNGKKAASIWELKTRKENLLELIKQAEADPDPAPEKKLDLRGMRREMQEITRKLAGKE